MSGSVSESGSGSGSDSGSDSVPRRGLGTLTARVPGTTEVIAGVRLVSHRVRATIQDGFARTEIEEEFLNETSRVLEGRFVFPVPAGATVSRLALWVGHDLIEGEVLERGRASRIFRGIVEDTVRPRDPALLEWVRGSELSLTIFPIPAKSSRKVVLAYVEELPGGDASRYVHALSLGTERAVAIDDFQVSVRLVGAAREAGSVVTPGWNAHVSELEGDLTVEYAATGIAPDRDFVVERGARGGSEQASEVVTFAEPDRKGRAAPRTFFAARTFVPLPEGALPRLAGDRVLVLDVSDSQTAETLAAQVRTVRAVVATLAPREQVAVLACDTACESFPARGLVGAGPREGALDTFLHALRPRGASDLAGAIASGAARLREGTGGQLIVMHDGKATAGELSTDRVAERLAPVLAARGDDLRLVGVGRSVDEVALDGLARALGASYEPLAGEGPLEERAQELARGLAQPLLVDAHVELPDAFRDVVPSSFASLRLGEAVTLYGTLAQEGPGVEGARAKVTGLVGGEPIELEVPLRAAADRRPNPLLPKLWADRTIAELEVQDDQATRRAIVDLSVEHHVLSRHTSFLVLESERMFAEFGVKRTTLRPEDHVDHEFGGGTTDPPAPPTDGASEMLGKGSALSEAAQGFGAGSGRLSGSHRTRPPQIRMGHTSVSGRLPPESVQRIVRLNMGRFRACYEQGLQRNPTLSGRVATRFVIDRAGNVSSTADAGSDLPDAQVVACVVRQFAFLGFPQPEGGIVTVTYPIVFSSDGTRPERPATLWPQEGPPKREYVPPPPSTWRPRRFVAPQPTVTFVVTHVAGDETWRTARSAEVTRLAEGVRAKPESRAARERWVRALMQQGRFPEARDEAAAFVAMDPDLGLARELLAQAASATGEDAIARAELGALVELAPKAAKAHLRAARALEATGDVRRACAHRRALADLDPAGHAGSLAEACWELVAAGGAEPAPPRDARPGTFTATVTCAEGPVSCPEVVVVTPTGRALSRSAPFDAAPIPDGLAIASAGQGLYRTVLVGGDERARGTVRVVAHGRAREVAFDRGDDRTALTTRIEEEWVWPAVVRY